MKKLQSRFDVNFGDFENVLNFFSNKGKVTYLNNTKILNIAIDTVRQLYKGTIENTLLTRLSSLTADGLILLEKDDVNTSNDLYFRHLTIPCDVKLSRMGKNSGYRYKLQNNDIGIVILLGSYYKQAHKEGSHLKIELSPHFIAERSAIDIQQYMDNIADMFLINPEPDAISPHLCVDVQGWTMPLHIEDGIITRSKRIRTYKGIENVEFEGFNSVLMTYGRSETLMVGNANSLQLSLYRKDLEILKTDKVDYFHELWDQFSIGGFDKTLPVYRFEYRFHQTIIKEFERGIGESINTFLEVYQYLNDLWRYALNTIRHETDDSVTPIWQLLYEDITFNNNDFREVFKRQQKAKSDTTSVRHNIGLMLGNFTSLMARKRIKFKEVVLELKKLTYFQEIIKKYLLESNIDESVFWDTQRHKYLLKLI